MRDAERYPSEIRELVKQKIYESPWNILLGGTVYAPNVSTYLSTKRFLMSDLESSGISVSKGYTFSLDIRLVSAEIFSQFNSYIYAKLPRP